MLDVCCPVVISCLFASTPTQKGDQKTIGNRFPVVSSHAVREAGKTGFQVAGVGCECLPGESLGSRFGARLKESGNSPTLWKQVGRSPASIPFRQRFASGSLSASPEAKY
jgi:hypothetical protein